MWRIETSCFLTSLLPAFLFRVQVGVQHKHCKMAVKPKLNCTSLLAENSEIISDLKKIMQKSSRFTIPPGMMVEGMSPSSSRTIVTVAPRCSGLCQEFAAAHSSGLGKEGNLSKKATCHR